MRGSCDGGLLGVRQLERRFIRFLFGFFGFFFERLVAGIVFHRIEEHQFEHAPAND